MKERYIINISLLINYKYLLAKLDMVAKLLNENLMNKSNRWCYYSFIIFLASISKFQLKKSTGSSPSHHMSLSFTKGVMSPVRGGKFRFLINLLDAHLLYEKEKEKTKKWLQNKEAVEKMTLTKMN